MGPNENISIVDTVIKVIMDIYISITKCHPYQAKSPTGNMTYKQRVKQFNITSVPPMPPKAYAPAQIKKHEMNEIDEQGTY